MADRHGASGNGGHALYSTPTSDRKWYSRYKRTAYTTCFVTQNLLSQTGRTAARELQFSMGKSTMGRIFCFTSNDGPARCGAMTSTSSSLQQPHPALGFAQVTDWLAATGKIDLAVVQLERAPNTGHLHFQGCVKFKQPRTLSAAISIFGTTKLHGRALPSHRARAHAHLPLLIDLVCDGPCVWMRLARMTLSLKHEWDSNSNRPLRHVVGAHLELCKGKWTDNVEYCTKQSSRVAGPWYLGDCSHPEAVDLELTAPPSFDHLPPNWRFVTLCWGPPAIGKSRVWSLICDYVGGGTYHVPGKAKNSSGRWLGDYRGEHCAIIDEFDFDSDFEESQWKLILDRRPQNLPATMGGKSVLWSPQIIVLLSNHPIGAGHPFTSMVFRTRFSESFNDWNWITTAEGERHPRLPCPLYHPPIQLHSSIDLYPRYIPPSERGRGKKRPPPTAAGSADLVSAIYARSGVRYTTSNSGGSQSSSSSCSQGSQSFRPPPPPAAASTSAAASPAHSQPIIDISGEEEDDRTLDEQLAEIDRQIADVDRML